MVEVAWRPCECLQALAALPQLLCRPGGGLCPGKPETWDPVPPPPAALRMRALQQQHADCVALYQCCTALSGKHGMEGSAWRAVLMYQAVPGAQVQSLKLLHDPHKLCPVFAA